MSLAEEIRRLPSPSREPAGKTIVDRKSGASMFGADSGAPDSFSGVFGNGQEWDPKAERNRDHGGQGGSRMGVSDAFAEAAEGYKPHITVKAHSRFSPVSKQMLDSHPAKNADEGAFEKARDLYLRSEDGGQAFADYLKTLTPEQAEYISNRIDEEGETEN